MHAQVLIFLLSHLATAVQTHQTSQLRNPPRNTIQSGILRGKRESNKIPQTPWSQILGQLQQPIVPVSPLEERYPKNPYIYIPGHVPNSNPEHKPETHIFYDRKNMPYVATAKNETTRIGGDRAVERWEYPHQIQIRNSTFGHFCGGSLIMSPTTGKQLVLTAAHCLFFEDGLTRLRPLESLRIRAGNVAKEGYEGEWLRVKKAVIHPDARKLNSKAKVMDDVAIIIPDGEFTLSWHVKPISLPRQGQPLLAKYVSVTGWGLGRGDGKLKEISDLLRVVEVPVLDQKTCEKNFDGHRGIPGNVWITKAHFCAGFMQGGVDSCVGDSGGAAVGIELGMKYLAGIVSWGKGCAEAGYPGVYVLVSHYVDWICRASYED